MSRRGVRQPQHAPRQMFNVAALLNRLTDAIADLGSVSEGEMTSIEGGTLDTYDDDGQLVVQMGVFPDGSTGIEHVGGPAPETPTEPDVQALAGGAVIVSWDGEFEDAQPRKQVDRIAVHMGTTPDFAIVTNDDDESDEDATEVGAIYSRRGGTTVVSVDPGQTYYFRLTTVTKDGQESDPTDAVPVAVGTPEASFWQDTFTLATAGEQELVLTYTPIDNSEHVYWWGLYQQEDTTWSRVGKVVTITGDPMEAQAGDLITVEYAYLDDDLDTDVPYTSDGWSFYRTTYGDATDRSAVDYDDDSWESGRAPFGVVQGTPPYDWPTPNTTWDLDSRIWLRRDVGAEPGRDLEVTVRYDNMVAVYWNGALIASAGSDADPPDTLGPLTIDGADVLPTNVIAIRATDDSDTSPSDDSYIDVMIERP